MPPIQMICLGLSHHTTSLEVRERFRRSLGEAHTLLPSAQQAGMGEPEAGRFAAIQEVLFLSTCNRIEIYASFAPDTVNGRSLLLHFLACTHGVDTVTFQQYLYCHMGEAAAAHLLRVAAGLDSVALGESQILGQITDAYVNAVTAGTAGPVLSTLFQAAIRTGKRARRETDIGRNPSSISAVAIALAQQVVGDLNNCQTLVVGLGEMGRLALKALRARGLSQIAVANRTMARAMAAVAPWHGRAYTLSQLAEALLSADVVITATGAPHTILDTALVEQVMAQRPKRPLVLVDIAAPADVATAVGDLPGVHLLGIDHLHANLDDAVSARQQEIPQVEAIITEELAALNTRLRELTIRPLIADLRHKAELIRQQELQRTLRHLGDVDPQMLAHIHHLSRSLMNKLLHEPTMRLRQKAGGGETAESAEYAAIARDLFGLENRPEP
jgi:glutamyl-tRNA reductase